MPLLHLTNLPGPPVAVPAGATLLAAIQGAGHDWRHACGAKGRCTTCRLQVLAGAEHLTPRTAPELRYLGAGRLLAHERLACQVRLPQGEATARVPDATKLSHVAYVD